MLSPTSIISHSPLSHFISSPIHLLLHDIAIASTYCLSSTPLTPLAPSYLTDATIVSSRFPPSLPPSFPLTLTVSYGRRVFLLSLTLALPPSRPLSPNLTRSLAPSLTHRSSPFLPS